MCLPAEGDKRGRSLVPLCHGRADSKRKHFVISEIHGNGWPDAGYAVRKGKWKFCEYLSGKPALFDLENDPEELNNLAAKQTEDPVIKATINDMRATLAHEFGDIYRIDQCAKNDQRTLRKKLEAGGRLDELLDRNGFERHADRLVPKSPPSSS